MSIRKASTDPAWFYLKHYDKADPFKDAPGAIRGHLGVDFNGRGMSGGGLLPEGTEIPAISNFVVAAVGANSAIGNYVVLRVPDGYLLFYHLASRSPLVVGEAGGYGDLVGILGNTGSTSGGAHAHVGYSKTDPTPGTDKVSDPWPLIQAYIAAATQTGDFDMRVYEDGGKSLNVPPGNGPIFLGGPGVWVPINWPATNLRGIMAQSFGGIIRQSTADLAQTKRACLAAAPPSTPMTDTQIAQLAERIAGLVPSADPAKIARAVTDEAAKRLAA